MADLTVADVRAIALSAFISDPRVGARLDKGQQFNTYESHSGWQIGIGPVTNFFGFAKAGSQDVAEAIVDALRIATGQPPLVSSAALAREQSL